MTMVIATVSIVTVSRQIMTNVLLVLILSDFILGQTMSIVWYQYKLILSNRVPHELL